MAIEVENISGRTLKGVEIIEAVPKQMAENAALIKSDANYYVIEADPIMQFQLGDLQPGEKKTVDYSFERSAEQGEVTAEMFNAMEAPITLVQMQFGDKCLGVMCNDYDLCTRDYCVEGECTYAPMEEEAKCGPEMVCRQGKCTAAEGETKPISPEKTTPPEMFALAGIIAALLIVSAATIAIKKGRKQNKPAEKNQK